MQLELEVYGALCALSTFRINGVDCDEEHFGEGADDCPDTAEPYGCGDYRWKRIPLEKQYDGFLADHGGITPEEYDEVCERLEELLSFGSCGWCV
jgi:hypothetical protein